MRPHFRFILLVSILLTSCQTGFTNISQKFPVAEIGKISAGKYTGIAWISEDTLILEVDKGNIFENQRMCSQQRINIYEMKTNQWQLVPLPFENECRSYTIRNLQVPPTQQAGYIFEDPTLNSKVIKRLDRRTATGIDLYTELAGNSSLDRFSYSPNMKELLLVDASSTLLESAIYLLDTNGSRTNITADFLRADFPTWSSKSNLIAFLGTKPYPGSEDEIKDYSQIERRFDYPWRLYLYDPESLSTEELPLDLVHPSALKWSPDGKMLAFSGEYGEVPGVWIIENLDNQDNLKIIKLVGSLATFDFSPDSKSIAFAYIGLQNKDKQNILYRMNLTASNIKSPSVGQARSTRFLPSAPLVLTHGQA